MSTITSRLLRPVSRALQHGLALCTLFAMFALAWLAVSCLPTDAWAQDRGATATSARHLLWTDLTPKDWDPGKLLRERFKGQNLDLLRDDDPKVQALMDAMRDMWDTAPVNDAMNGVTGRLPGYIVPLEEGPKGLKEFLLVPYYGACIHSPPPPANQIVHVRLAQPVKGFRTMDTVWVHGTLEVARGKSDMGASAYRIDARKVEAYTREKPQTAR
jgi:hypothetical protein